MYCLADRLEHRRVVELCLNHAIGQFKHALYGILGGREILANYIAASPDRKKSQTHHTKHRRLIGVRVLRSHLHLAVVSDVPTAQPLSLELYQNRHFTVRN